MVSKFYFILYLFLNLFLKYSNSNECFDFQCFDGGKLSKNCFKCFNVSQLDEAHWRSHLQEMIDTNVRLGRSDIEIKLRKKLSDGMFCCNPYNEPCSLSFSHGSKNGLPHYGMGCQKNDFWQYSTCKTMEIGSRCCQNNHCNGPNSTEMQFMIEKINEYYPHFPAKVDTHNYTYWIIILVSVFCLSVIGFVVSCVVRFYKSQSKRNLSIGNQFQKRSFYKKMHCLHKLFSFLRNYDRRRKTPMMDDLTSFNESLMGRQQFSSRKMDAYNDLTCSGSGAGRPLMTNRTAATDICLIRAVGEGRFGTVWLGKWNEDNVAVKIFSTRDERSWDREKQIYQKNFLRHSNVLGYVATDSRDNGLATELWLVTDYHENGSLYEYLRSHVLTVEQAVKMVRSITNGLAYLHNEINGTELKPGIAHRDLKSRNILVKSCGECCIGDLGLAVRLNEDSSVLDSNRVGTRRYMAPEVILGRIINKDLLYNGSLEVFKRADIYSYSLVLWEILRCCQCPSMRISNSSYEMPYQNLVSNDPSIDEMREVVCEKKIRPQIMQSWDNINPLKDISKSIQESWFDEPASRLNIMRLKKIMANAWNELLTLKMTIVDISENVNPSPTTAVNNSFVYRYPFNNSTMSTEFPSNFTSSDIPNIVIKTKDSYYLGSDNLSSLQTTNS